MRWTKKGKEWVFGMKAHVGVDEETGLADGVSATPANTHDVAGAHRLPHGKEERVWADSGYRGAAGREEQRGQKVDRRVPMRPGERRMLERDAVRAREERRKAAVRAKVEHPLPYVKRCFGYAKVRCRGLATNERRIALPLGFTNLLVAGRYGTAGAGRHPPGVAPLSRTVGFLG